MRMEMKRLTRTGLLSATVIVAATLLPTAPASAAPLAQPAVQAAALLPENQDLTPEQVRDRNEQIVSSYDVGEPLSFADAQFVKTYVAPVTQRKDLAQTTGTASRTFNKTGAGAGASVRISGSARTTICDFCTTNSWSTTLTATRVSGTVTGQTLAVNVYAYGAVGAWPYVGLVYSNSQSVKSTASPYTLSRSQSFSAFVSYMTIDPYVTVSTRSGSFQIHAF
jgi:hypothetical protein